MSGQKKRERGDTRETADAVVRPIRHILLAALVYKDRSRAFQRKSRGGRLITRYAATDQGSDRAALIDATDVGVSHIDKEDRSGSIDEDRTGVVDLCERSGAVIPTEPGPDCPRDGL